MDKNQRSLRWHRRRAHNVMVATTSLAAINAGSCNETVKRMHYENIAEAERILRHYEDTNAKVS